MPWSPLSKMALSFIRRGAARSLAIADLQMAGGGADLDVSIREADGTVTSYLVPFSSVPNMLQAGVSKYDLAAGRSHIEGADRRADFIQGDLSVWSEQSADAVWWFDAVESLFGFTLGTGWNTWLGAISVDAAQSHSEQDNGTYDGQKLSGGLQ